MRIDLHTHSNASDGTDDPRAIPRLAYKAGITVVGITDHDTISGWESAADEASSVGVQLVRGMEMTTHILLDQGEYAGCPRRISAHVLAYLFNPYDPAMQAHIERMAHAREERARRIVANISSDFPLTWDMVESQRKLRAPLGRPHIADALVKLGIVKNRTEAFAGILSAASPYREPLDSPNAHEVLNWIQDAGGISVLAHPKAHGRGSAIPDDSIRELAQAGLWGIEVHHRDNPPAVRPSLQALAQECQLWECGSSDYHGTGKPNRMGENITAEETYHALIADSFLGVVA